MHCEASAGLNSLPRRSAADGFYEWQKVGAKKQPWHFTLKGGEPFAFASLWEFWKSPEGESVESCTIITTDANDVLLAGP